MIGFYIEKDTFINKILKNKKFNTTDQMSGVEAKEELMKIIDESNVIFEPDYISYQFKLPVERYDFKKGVWQIDRNASISKDINDVISINSRDASGQKFKIIVEGLNL